MQTKFMSAVESATNAVVGFGVAIGAQLVVFPLFDMHPSLEQNVAMVCIFTVVSLVRSYCLRRLFNGWKN